MNDEKNEGAVAELWRSGREDRQTVPEHNVGEKERCSGSYRLAVGFLLIKDESISERPG